MVNKDPAETGARGGGCSRFPKGLTGACAHMAMGHRLKPWGPPQPCHGPPVPSVACLQPVCQSLVGITVKIILLKYVYRISCHLPRFSMSLGVTAKVLRVARPVPHHPACSAMPSPPSPCHRALARLVALCWRLSVPKQGAVSRPCRWLLPLSTELFAPISGRSPVRFLQGLAQAPASR